jgi:hypothetical protein
VQLLKDLAFLGSVIRLTVTTNVVPSWPILVTLIMEAIISSETWVLRRATRRNIPKDGVLHSILHGCETFPFEAYYLIKEQSKFIRREVGRLR